MAGITFGGFLSDQRMSLPLVVTKQTCSGATYIITGANKGLGFEAAKHLVEVGAAKVILAVRNTQAGNAAMAVIEAATHTENVVEVWELDLSSYASVKAFANKAIIELDRFDALIECRYAVSKIIQVFAIRQLAILADYNRTGVVVKLVGPGFCKTELSVNSPFVLRMSIKLGNMLIGRTAELGSRTLLHGAIAGKESHGCYLGNCEVREDSVLV
ncbi:hypothetical protein HYFRA_00011303 [Hymenoscyphus fraxineus]|uniref:NAD(P)-binding protein n=1 Tax=Hymenoscyphus fraxineus TaxID=746836 RepID=A0A9N9KYD5_9HELO|nr:hypothetical protein HYFRA_00011303 [Hymenoscyphus fraxineus]